MVMVGASQQFLTEIHEYWWDVRYDRAPGALVQVSGSSEAQCLSDLQCKPPALRCLATAQAAELVLTASGGTFHAGARRRGGAGFMQCCRRARDHGMRAAGGATELRPGP